MEEYLYNFLAQFAKENNVKKIISSPLYLNATTTPNKAKEFGTIDYDVLEKYGDKFYDSILSDYLYKRYGERLKSEDLISKIINHYKGKFFNKVVFKIGLDKWIKRTDNEPDKIYIYV